MRVITRKLGTLSFVASIFFFSCSPSEIKFLAIYPMDKIPFRKGSSRDLLLPIPTMTFTSRSVVRVHYNTVRILAPLVAARTYLFWRVGKMIDAERNGRGCPSPHREREQARSNQGRVHPRTIYKGEKPHQDGTMPNASASGSCGLVLGGFINVRVNGFSVSIGKGTYEKA